MLARSKVAIAGAGGDGGLLTLSLARMGIRRFSLADPEAFAVENTNRQAGCTTETIGRNKPEVIAELVRAIAPDADVDVSPDGITPHNVDAFLTGANVVADETEYTRHEVGVMLARASRHRDLPVVMALNVGFGCLVTSFLPGGWSLEDQLGLSRTEPLESIRARRVHLARWIPRLPAYTEASVLKAVQAGRLAAPSVSPGVCLAAGLAAVEVFNHLVARRRPVAAPRVLWADALEGRSGVVRFPRATFAATVLRLALGPRLGPTVRLHQDEGEEEACTRSRIEDTKAS